ncbi:MAG: PKD domain-containing protein [Bacteroidales bacterium]|nr:PKD domain-containing protein [Bacteroidales bacterium]
MAELGLVPYNPSIPIAPAEYKGSQIMIDGITIDDSPDIPVSNATDLTESENSVFVDPNDNQYVLNSNNSTGWNGSTYTTLYGANYFQSANGAATWGGSYQGAGGTNSGDPTTAISRDGRQFVNFISSAGGQGIAYSDDGSSWTSATVGPNPGSLADKNHMWIDNSTSSSYEGNLYVAWTDFGGSYDSEIVFSRSTNDGVSWSTRINLSAASSAGSHNQGVNIQTGPNGEVYVVWAIYDSWPSDESRLGMAKSINGGVSFGSSYNIITNIRGIRTTEVPQNMRVNSFPVMAVDISGGSNNGNIYVVWTNIGTPGVNSGTAGVYMIRSTNGGTSWSTPIKVNQGSGTAYFPWITCDPETGNLAVIFYDNRNTATASCEAWVAYSTDAGNNWTDFRVSDVAFTPSPINGLASGYMGDYLGITAKGNRFYPCWTDTRNNLYMTYVSPFELGLNASFSADNTSVCSGSSVTFTDNSSGPPTTWNWSFPGGTPSSASGQGPHNITYNTPGTYNVSLTVGDGVDTDTETKTGYITVQNIIADFVGTPTTVIVGNSVTFTNLSDCSPTSWNWSFPGGTPSSYSGANPPAITYNSTGSFNVSLTVSGPSGTDIETKTGYINVINCVYCTSTSSNATEEWISNVTFNTINNTTGGVTGYVDYTSISTNVTPGSNYTLYVTCDQQDSWTEHIWAFIDWNQNCELDDSGEIYDLGQVSGPATLSLNITVPTNAASGPTRMRTSLKYNGDPTACETFTYGQVEDYTINVQSTGGTPVANFSANNTFPNVGETVTFNDLSSNLPTSWSWSFNPTTITYVGGTNSSSQNPQVQFNAAGSYTVSLTATNTYGSDSETKLNYIQTINTIPPYVDGFESFSSGQYLAVASPYWTTWTNTPGSSEDNVIITNPTHTGTKAVKVDGVTDLVLPLGDKTSGKYLVSFYIYVPSGYYAYYNLLQLFNSTSSEWGMEVFFSTGGSGYGNAGGSNSFTFSYSYNTWIPIENIIDLDNDLAQIWINGIMVRQFQWSIGALGDGSLKQLGGLDMYAWNASGTPLYYFDDLSYFEIINLDLDVYLEGPYNTSNGLMNTALNQGVYIPLSQPFNVAPWNYNGTESVASISDPTYVDWVLIELRDAFSADQANGSTIIGRKAGFLKSNGQVVDINGNTALEFKVPVYNNLFVAVYHLNHLGIISSGSPVKSGSVYTYNFSTSSGQAYGTDAQKFLGGNKWGMYGGDGDHNGGVGIADKISLWQTQAGAKGYLGSDYNLDTESNNLDKDDIWFPNFGTGSQIPN